MNVGVKVPLLDLSREVEELWDELQESIEAVLKSGRFVLGPSVEALEDEVARYIGVKYAIGVNSGTDALKIALRALGIGPGDEVITVAFTFLANAEAIVEVGATPVFVDVEPDTYNISPERIEEAITDKTRAIMPVHLFGHPADMDLIMEIAERRGLWVIEDCAQAFGAEYKGRKVGSIGHVAAFSFYPTKNLSAYGDGGMVLTSDSSLAEKMKSLRVHGQRDKYYSEEVGYNSRLDEIQAAILRVKLKRVDSWNARRRELASRYSEAFKGLGITVPLEREWAKHVYHQYTIRTKRRDELKAFLAERGIVTALYYPYPIYEMPAYEAFKPERGLPNTERLTREVLSLPIWHYMRDKEQEAVIEAVKEFYENQ